MPAAGWEGAGEIWILKRGSWFSEKLSRTSHNSGIKIIKKPNALIETLSQSPQRTRRDLERSIWKILVPFSWSASGTLIPPTTRMNTDGSCHWRIANDRNKFVHNTLLYVFNLCQCESVSSVKSVFQLLSGILTNVVASVHLQATAVPQRYLCINNDYFR